MTRLGDGDYSYPEEDPFPIILGEAKELHQSVILSEANGYRDVGGRATQEAKADGYREVGGRKRWEPVFENL